MYGGQSTYIPLKVNQAGVIPIIFASSLLYIPVLMSNVLPWASLRNWVQHNLLNPTDGWYIVFYGVFIVLFTFFYVHVTFDPYQQADTIRKQGGYIPGFQARVRRPSTTSHGSSTGSRSRAASSWRQWR